MYTKYLNIALGVLLLFLCYEVYTLRSEVVSQPQLYIVEESKFDDNTAYQNADVTAMHAKLRQVTAYLASQGGVVITDRAVIAAPDNKDNSSVKFIKFKDIERLVLQDKMQQLDGLNLGK